MGQFYSDDFDPSWVSFQPTLTRTDETQYLQALTKGIDEPNLDHLDAYIKPFISGPISRKQWLQAATDIRGLNGSNRATPELTPRYADPGIATKQHQFDQRRNYDLD